MVKATVKVRSKVGLHARPAALFVQEAMKHACRITVVSGDRKADAKSILQVLALGVKYDQEIEIVADGPGEHEAVTALVTAVENGLGDA